MSSLDRNLRKIAPLDSPPLLHQLDAAGRIGNANVAAALRPGDLDGAEARIAALMAAMLRELGIDQDTDHNAADTPRRFAKMMVREVCAGRFQPMPALTDFPNASRLDQLYTVGPITVRSCCAHHLCPIEGEAWCGVIPSERVIGLSKFARLTDWIMRRPQIQEEATVQLADLIEQAIAPVGLAVVVRARHACMTWRGVQERSTNMTTSVMRGALRDHPEARAEFMSLINGQGFTCR